MFASMIPIYWRRTEAGGGLNQISEATLGSLIRLRGPSSLRSRDPRVVGVFGVAGLACDLGRQARALIN